MFIEKALLAGRRAALGSIAALFGIACAGLVIGGTSPVLAQSGEFGAIYLQDVPGFVGAGEADTVIACRPDGTCVTEDDNVLVGFRPAVWPNLRSVGDDLVLETNVQVLATAFGRILLREGTIAETFASGPATLIQSVNANASGDAAVAITPHTAWAPNNFGGSDAVWISYANTGVGGDFAAPLGTTFTVRESFSVPLGSTGNVDGFVFADDTAQVVLVANGTETTLFSFNEQQDNACAAGPIGCEVTDKGDLILEDLPPGDYALEFTARQDSADTNPDNNPFGLQYFFRVSLDPPTVADFCWTFDGGIPGEKVCVSIAECDNCQPTPEQCPAGGNAITLTSGEEGDAICNDLAQQFFDRGATEELEEFQFVIGLDVPDIANPGSVRVATCTIGGATYVPICRDPSSSVVNATVTNDIPVAAFETPRCVTSGGKTYC